MCGRKYLQMGMRHRVAGMGAWRGDGAEVLRDRCGGIRTKMRRRGHLQIGGQ